MIVIMIDGSKKHNCDGDFELYSLRVFEKHSKMQLMEL